MQVSTKNDMEYTFFPVQKLRKYISIKAGHDGHLSFTSAESDTTPMVEIFIGGWNNSKSAIRFNKTKPDKAVVDTPNILSEDEHRNFIFEWSPNGTEFNVYRQTEKEPFLSWKNPDSFPVTHFGVRTSWGATGEWVCDGLNIIGTVDTMEYNYNPVESVAGRLGFRILAGNDAHVCLTSGPSAEAPIHEIFLGGWDNSKCAIRHNKEKPDVAESATPCILSSENPQEFWIDWKHDSVTVGSAHDTIMAWTTRVSHIVTHFGLRTAYGSTGEWTILEKPYTIKTAKTCNAHALYGAPPEDDHRIHGATEGMPITGFSWVAATKGSVPHNAVTGGSDTGEEIYVARAQLNDDLIPGKLVPSHGVTYIPYGGTEHGIDSYEVLVAPTSSILWVADKEGSVPGNAIPGGETEYGEQLFIGRTQHEGAITIGKIHPSHRCLYISYDGQEISYTEYEALVSVN